MYLAQVEGDGADGAEGERSQRDAKDTARTDEVQGYLAHKKSAPLGPPQGPMQSPTIGPYAYSYFRALDVVLP